MAIAHVEQEVPASAEKVWSLIQDFTDMSAWANPDMSLTAMVRSAGPLSG